MTVAEFKDKLGGEIVRLEGTVTGPNGEMVLFGSGAVRVSESCSARAGRDP